MFFLSLSNNGNKRQYSIFPLSLFPVTQSLPTSPVFVPHPVFVPEPGEKERIREEVEHRIEQEERRQEQEEWRRQEHERRQQQEMVRQQEQRRKQEVEYWRSKVQEEERRREKEEQERKGWGSEELLKPAASYREARLVTLQEVLGEQEEQEGSHESVELPPRVRMECFRSVTQRNYIFDFPLSVFL